MFYISSGRKRTETEWNSLIHSHTRDAVQRHFLFVLPGFVPIPELSYTSRHPGVELSDITTSLKTIMTQAQLDAGVPARTFTFMGRLGVRRERDIIELAKAKPLAVHRHAEVAEINGFPGGLGDLVCGGSRGLALRRQIRHDDSAVVSKANSAEGKGAVGPRKQKRGKRQR